MKYLKNLSKKEREKIFGLFQKKTKLRFSEIEKTLKIRSNALAYHLEAMQKQELIEKKNDFYYLTKNAEKYIPNFSHLAENKLSPLPIVLVSIINKDKILLIKRTKRPYKTYWAMIGGKILLDESIEDASLRLVREKTNLNGKFKSINAVLHERVQEKGIIKYGFILFMTKISVDQLNFKETPSGKLKWFDAKKLKGKIVPSDSWLINNKLNSKINIENVMMDETNGKISKFKIKKSGF
ncbi:MAG: NUDIX domain-containing protein [Candidatus Nanoarchaeia archaeon]|nr:NUDIX domain-containing protein [Candidatus Nanoarchaeia archaeon]